MPKTTTNLGLNKTDTTPDGGGSFVDKNEYFNFDTDLNDNWDVIDSATGKLSDLTTEEQNSLVGAINEINNSLPDVNNLANVDLNNLTSTGKDNLIKLAHELDYDNAITVSTTSSTSAQSYVCPADGILNLNVAGTGTTSSSKRVQAVIMTPDHSINLAGGHYYSSVQMSNYMISVSYPFKSGSEVHYIAAASAFSTNTVQVNFIPFKKS